MKTGFMLAAAVTVALLFSVAAAAPVLADTGPHNGSHSMPSVAVSTEFNRLIVKNSNITVWFQGFKPVLHIFKRGQDGNVTGFTVAVNSVLELNSTNRPDAVLPLIRSYPFVASGSSVINYSSGVSVTYDKSADMVNITYSLTSSEFAVMPFNMTNGPTPVQPQPMDMMTEHMIGPASIQLVFHINAMSAHVKFDFIVNQWTWENTTSDRLALDMVVLGHFGVKDMEGMHPTYGGTYVDDNNQGNEAQSNAAGVHMPEYITISNLTGIQGFVSWGKEANATYYNGTTAHVNVTVAMFSHGFMEDDFTFDHLLFVFTPPTGWATNYSKLVYDPVIGYGSPSVTTTSQPVQKSPLGFASGVSGSFALLAALVAVIGSLVAVSLILVHRRRH